MSTASATANLPKEGDSTLAFPFAEVLDFASIGASAHAVEHDPATASAASATKALDAAVPESADGECLFPEACLPACRRLICRALAENIPPARARKVDENISGLGRVQGMSLEFWSEPSVSGKSDDEPFVFVFLIPAIRTTCSTL